MVMPCFATLPEEIFVDILSRLPAKSIGQFRCVSKPWRTLLSQPEFIKTHHNRIRQLPEESLILISNSRSEYFVPFRNAHQLFDEINAFSKELNFAGYHKSWTAVLCSYDGLVLLKGLFLINPTTREIKMLPNPPYAFDPHDAAFTMYGLGLGYDSVSDDYKVVTLSYYDTYTDHWPDYTEFLVYVYSVKNGTWRRVKSSPYDHAAGPVTSGVFVDGSIHWLARETRYYSPVIEAFNLAEERFYEVPLPSSVDREKFVFDHLGVLGGCLSMYSSRRNNETDVWVMKEYGVEESWTKFTIIDPQGVDFRPLCLLGQEQVVLVKDEVTVEVKLVIYNLKERTLKDIVVHGIPDLKNATGTLMESLVSHHCTNETGGE